MKTIVNLGGALFFALNCGIAFSDPCAPVDGVATVSTSGPCYSIQAAIDAAPGTRSNPTVINVATGTYAEKLTIRKGNIAIRGEGYGLTGIDGDIVINGNGLKKPPQNIEISQISVYNYTGTTTIDISNAEDVLIANNRLMGTFGSTYHVRSIYMNKNIVVNNNIILNGRVGVYADHADNLVVSGNAIRTQYESALLAWDSTGTASGNTISSIGSSAIGIHRAVAIHRGDWTITNNDVINSPYADGVFVEGRRVANIISNVMTGNGDGVSTFDLHLYGASTTAVVDSNVFDTLGGDGTISSGTNTRSDGTTW